MSSIVSRWPVVVHAALGAGDVDDEGRLSSGALERVFSEARDAYLALCHTVEPGAVVVRSMEVRPGDTAVTDAVTVSAGVVELYPDSFVMNGRIRPADGPGVVADVVCTLSAGEVTTAMRDEFISLAHTAAHVH